VHVLRSVAVVQLTIQTMINTLLYIIPRSKNDLIHVIVVSQPMNKLACLHVDHMCCITALRQCRHVLLGK